jgi:hypothetical protein
MAKLVPSLPHLLISSEDSIHGTDGTQIFFLIEQSGIDLLRGLVHEPLGVKGIEHYLPFPRIKSPGRGRPVLWGQRLSADPFAIDPGSGNPKNSAGRL